MSDMERRASSLEEEMSSLADSSAKREDVAQLAYDIGVLTADQETMNLAIAKVKDQINSRGSRWKGWVRSAADRSSN